MTVELSIGILIVISVALTLLEFSLPESSPNLAVLDRINLGITLVFGLELTLRFIAAPSKKRYFKEFWIDIIAVVPLFRVLRTARALRLLRLLRLIRVMGIFNRYVSYFPYALRRGSFEYITVFGLIILTVVFGTAGILALERQAVNPQISSFREALWFSIYSLFAGEPIPGPPSTLGGRIIAVMVMFMGLTIFAMFTGTFSAFMVDRLRKEGRVVEWEEFSNHVIICGWSRKADIIIREFREARGTDTPIVIIALEDEDGPDFSELPAAERIYHLKEDFTKVSALEKARVHRAHTCIIISDSRLGRSEQDADARTILAALTVEKLNPDIYTCTELINREYGSHLEMGQINDYIYRDDHSAFLLAQAAINRGLMEVFTELLTYERGNQFYKLPLPRNWTGKTFLDLYVQLKQSKNAILVAVQDDENYRVNPKSYTFHGGEDVVIIAREEIELEH
jgi:voltage-gated potassium channel